MTPERLEEIRTYVATVEEYSGGLTLYEASNELLAALDAERAAVTHLKRELVAELAERDELRGKVAAFEAFVRERRDTYELTLDSHAFAAMQMAFNEAVVRGLELGLWEE